MINYTEVILKNCEHVSLFKNGLARKAVLEYSKTKAQKTLTSDCPTPLPLPRLGSALKAFWCSLRVNVQYPARGDDPEENPFS